MKLYLKIKKKWKHLILFLENAYNRRGNLTIKTETWDNPMDIVITKYELYLCIMNIKKNFNLMQFSFAEVSSNEVLQEIQRK